MPANNEVSPLPSRACSDLVSLKAVENDEDGALRRIFSAYLGRKIDKGVYENCYFSSKDKNWPIKERLLVSVSWIFVIRADNPCPWHCTEHQYKPYEILNICCTKALNVADDAHFSVTLSEMNVGANNHFNSEMNRATVTVPTQEAGETKVVWYTVDH